MCDLVIAISNVCSSPHCLELQTASNEAHIFHMCFSRFKNLKEWILIKNAIEISNLLSPFHHIQFGVLPNIQSETWKVFRYSTSISYVVVHPQSI